MKYGMNMLLWTTNVDESHDSILANLKEWGYDGVELPCFQMEEANWKRLGKRLESLKLESTLVTVSGGDAKGAPGLCLIAPADHYLA